MNNPGLLELFKLFLYIGATGFGGVAMLPKIRAHLVDETKFLSGERYDYGIALAQMLPGPTIVQVAAFTGYSLYGYLGGLLCSLAIFIPAATLMYALTVLYFTFQSAAIVADIVIGMSAVIIIIVLQATYSAARTSLSTLRDYCLAAIGFVLFFLKLNAVFILLLSALLGLLFCSRKRQTMKATAKIISYPHWQILVMLAATVAIFAAAFILNPLTGKLAYYMTKTSFLAFGGGYAAIPIFIHDVVNSEHWLTLQQFMTGMMLGQITPGPVIVTATYIGYSLAGTPGAAVATFFVFAPAYLLAMLVTPIFNKLIHNKLFFRAVQGILCAFPGMLLSVSVTMLTEQNFNYLTVALCFFSGVMIILKKISPYKIILFAAAAEAIAFYIK